MINNFRQSYRCSWWHGAPMLEGTNPWLQPVNTRSKYQSQSTPVLFFEYCSNTPPFFYGQYPTQAVEEPQPTFGLPSPPSEVKPRGLRTAPPKQRAEEPKPTFGLQSPPSEVEPSGLRTTPPNQEAQEPQPTFSLPSPPSEVEPSGLRTSPPPPPNQGTEESQPNFGLPNPPSEVEPRGLRTAPPTKETRNPSQLSVYQAHPQMSNPVV